LRAALLNREILLIQGAFDDASSTTARALIFLR
jgi:hypothetical protein